MKQGVSFCIIVLTLLSVAGCKSKQSEITQDGGKTVVKMWRRTTSDSTQRDKDAAARMDAALKEKFPDITVEVKIATTGTDYRQEYDKALMAGNAPDFFAEISYVDIPFEIYGRKLFFLPAKYHYFVGIVVHFFQEIAQYVAISLIRFHVLFIL